MRFGLDIAQQRMPWDELVSRVQFAEELGFDGAWGFDHFKPMYGEGPGETFEGMTTLAALAGVTSRIRLGLLVTGVTYRHPSVFAAEAMTIDHASHGRLELSLGAAWFDEEHHELGIPFPSTPARFDLLEDALEIVQRLFTGEVVSYEGKVVSLKDARLLPTPGAAAPPADLDRGQRPEAHAAAGREVRRRVAHLGLAQLPGRGQRPGRRARRRGRPGPGDITRASSLSLDDLDTARKHAGEVARRRLRLPRLRLARRRPGPGRGLRPRRPARVHRLTRAGWAGGTKPRQPRGRGVGPPVVGGRRARRPRISPGVTGVSFWRTGLPSL